MRKANNAGKFTGKYQARQNVMVHLRAMGTPEARKLRKQMQMPAQKVTRGRTVTGWYGKAKPCRVKVNGKNRPCLAAAKAIMARR